MTPVAAYYLFLAEENERAAKRTDAVRPQGPSLLDRARALAGALRVKPSTARRPA
jgi:hypothetical protein